jgi:hypothetical protein
MMIGKTDHFTFALADNGISAILAGAYFPVITEKNRCVISGRYDIKTPRLCFNNGISGCIGHFPAIPEEFQCRGRNIGLIVIVKPYPPHCLTELPPGKTPVIGVEITAKAVYMVR